MRKVKALGFELADFKAQEVELDAVGGQRATASRPGYWDLVLGHSGVRQG